MKRVFGWHIKPKRGFYISKIARFFGTRELFHVILGASIILIVWMFYVRFGKGELFDGLRMQIIENFCCIFSVDDGASVTKNNPLGQVRWVRLMV